MIEHLREACYFTPIEELATYDGIFQNYDKVREFERDGSRWVVLCERSKSFLIEVKLTNELPLEIRPLPPEEAWMHGRTRDLAVNPPIGFEGQPPLGVTDPSIR